MPDAPKLFISYAHKDERWLNQLLEHLRPLVQQQNIAAWTDRQIPTGANWHTEIQRALKEANIAVLLVTPAFIDSRFIRDTELPELLNKRVVWIAVESSLYEYTPIAKLRCANNPARPLEQISKSNRNSAWVQICKKILELAPSDIILSQQIMPIHSIPTASTHQETGVRFPTPHISFGPGLNPKDGAILIHIPSGEFAMGEEGQSNNPRRSIFLDEYWIYKSPVTVAQYCQFCSETNRKVPNAPVWGWKDDHPIVNVSWNAAIAYCEWAGVQLPTEAQWEKAARGSDGLRYPWGNDWDSSKCQCSKKEYGDSESTSPVGSYPQGESPYGVSDMAGNVREWCADWFEADYYTVSSAENPIGPASGDVRVLRGGSWYDFDPDVFRCAYRRGGIPFEDIVRGFRCCK